MFQYFLTTVMRGAAFNKTYGLYLASKPARIVCFQVSVYMSFTKSFFFLFFWMIESIYWPGIVLCHHNTNVCMWMLCLFAH